MNAMTAAIEAEAAALPPDHQMGANGPPEPTPFEAVRVHIEDLLSEAYNWADGKTVETQKQADEASRLIDDLRKAAKAAEDVQTEEQKPHDDAIAEIRARYRPLIQDPKTKSPGKVWKAIDALKACVKPYLDKLEADRQAAAAEARRAAEEAQRIASEAARAAQASDLAAQDAAEDLVLAAKQAAAQAKAIEAAKPQARGGDRALGLKKTFTAQVDDPRLLLLHYWGTKDKPGANRDPLLECLRQMAQSDTDRHIRGLPGVTVIEGTKL